MTTVAELPTPALCVEAAALEHNLATMAAALPGARLRPHVKAHKCTAIARLQAAAGHHSFCAATVREVEGLAAAGLGDDLLLANEVVDADRLRRLARLDARVTVAVDSVATVEAAARAGIREVLVDVDVGLPRCGCTPLDAGRIAEAAAGRGLEVRGVMGYEGHVVGLADRGERTRLCDMAMELLAEAHGLVGGGVVSAGGTGTYDLNTFASEIQAGSYVLMDTAYAHLDLPFRNALTVMATVVSVSDAYAVADCGLKALGMDHGNPDVEGGTVWFCSDEHLTFAPQRRVRVGDRVRVVPAHVDPTVAYHERIYLVHDGDVVDAWPVDLRGW
ncbi:MAG: alanine racemase [Acidimicrobiia bacterium]